MNGYTVKQYWEKEGAVIVKCNDVPNPEIKFHTESWKNQNKQIKSSIRGDIIHIKSITT